MSANIDDPNNPIPPLKEGDTLVTAFKEGEEPLKESSIDYYDHDRSKKKRHHDDTAVSDDGMSMWSEPMREFNVQLRFLRMPIAFNPATSFIGFAALWGLAIWCMVDPDGALDSLRDVRGKISLYFTWILIVSKPLSFFVIVYVAFKYGHVRLGGPNAKPHFSDAEYFAMLFAAGVAVGIFYYGVSEPLWHRDGNRFANSGFEAQDSIDQFAMNLTLYHWGFHPWAVYLTVAVTTALASFRFKLPLTFRSCFYPIFGQYTWGWIGDLIDGFSIVVTVAGVCTSLGIGAIQISAGLQRLGWVDQSLSGDELTNVQTTTIWVITAVATASVVSGLDVGIKYLSLFAFCLGIFLTFIVLALEKSAYILNLQVQSIGYYFQWSILQIPFHTDAFGQLREGEGRALEGAASDTWMDDWTIFYWNWWTTWACFVGLFVARISGGRTLREVILYSLVAPLFYCIWWFGVWGGTGLRQARQAEELEQLGTDFYGDPAHFRVDGSEVCYNVPQEDVVVGGEVIFTNYKKGITPVCQFDSGDQDSAAYNVLYSFSYPEDFSIGFGPTLTVLFLIALAIYFATSSDSGSLVVDFLASNGRHQHHWIQRLFWALTEGAVATALLNAGGSDGLAALQAAAIIAGLPFAVLLLYLLGTMIQLCEAAVDEDREVYETTAREFEVPVYGGIFNIVEYAVSFGRVHPDRVEAGMDLPEKVEVTEFFKALFLPFVSLRQILKADDPEGKHPIWHTLVAAVYATTFFMWIGLFCAIAKSPGFKGWGWGAFFVFGTILTTVKAGFRDRRGIHGNLAGDFASSVFLYPQVLTQMRVEQMMHGEEDLAAWQQEKTPNMTDRVQVENEERADEVQPDEYQET